MISGGIEFAADVIAKVAQHRREESVFCFYKQYLMLYWKFWGTPREYFLPKASIEFERFGTVKKKNGYRYAFTTRGRGPRTYSVAVEPLPPRANFYYPILPLAEPRALESLPVRRTQSSRPKYRSHAQLPSLLIAILCLASCADTRPAEEPNPTEESDMDQTSNSTSGSSTAFPGADDSGKTATGGTGGVTSSDGPGNSTSDDPGDVTSSAEPDFDPSIKLEGLDLDFNALFNYQNQDLPFYINHDNSPTDNPITDKGATLGRVLFYDPRLSTNNKISCASCHQQSHAFGDPRSLSDGVAGKTLRHSMRLVNLRFSEDFQVRWDRKANSVEEQMLMPIQDHVEMGYSGKDGNPNLDDLVKKLQAIKAYQVLFRLAWGDETVSKERIARALAQFVRSIQSFDSKYDEGQAQIMDVHDPFPNFSEDENAGKLLFLRNFNYETREIEVEVDGEGKKRFEVSQRVSGGLNCSACHRPPEFDIDPRSRNNGLTKAANPQAPEPIDYEAMRSPTLRDLIHPNGKLNGGLFVTDQERTSFEFHPVEII